MMNKHVGYIFYMLPILTVLLYSCNNKNEPVEQTIEFPVTRVAAIDTTAYLEYTANVQAVKNVELRAKVSGYLDKIYIDEGQVVKQGQLLFSISDMEFIEELSRATAAYKNAEAEVKSAEINLANVKHLVQKNVVSKTEQEMAGYKLQAALAKADEAKAIESAARLKLAYTQIKAPFDGKINRITDKPGSLVEVGTLLTTLSQDNEVFAYFNVSEKEYLDYAFNLKSGNSVFKEVSLILANGMEHSEKGVIETIEAEIDKNTGNIAFRARFKNPDHLLKHGSSGKIRLTKRFENVLVIPQKSTFEIQDKIYVYVVDQHDSVKTRAVSVSGRIPHLYVVKSGLNAGERMIYEGIQDVRQGIKIVPKYHAMHGIIKQLALQ